MSSRPTNKPTWRSHRFLWTLSTYLPANSWLHRLPAGAKMATVFVVTVLIALLRGWQFGAMTLAAVVIIAVTAAVPFRQLVSQVLRTMLFLLLLGAFVVWRAGVGYAVEMVLDLTAAITLAWLVTITTRTDDIFDTMQRALRPIDRSGRLANKVALGFAMVLRTIPALAEVTADARDAAAARGMSRDARALLTPMAIRTVAHAHTVGEALAARGVLDGPGRDV
ncbi:biotin transport system permease protein [Micrococcales bacterium KH10]|nr:biotin transport system permease protein [Micrococcales bacterium KH10]